MEIGRRRSSNLAVFDREIPVRSAIDFDFANLQLTAAQDSSDSSSSAPASRWGPYREILGEVLFNNRSKILAFNNKSVLSSQKQQGLANQQKRLNLYRPFHILDVCGLSNDDSLNLLDWGSNNCVAVALRNRVYMSNVPIGNTLLMIAQDASVTSVSWAPDGLRLAVGLSNSQVQIWDTVYSKQLEMLSGVHQHRSRIGSLAWNGQNILTSGGADGRIVDTDPRLKSSHAVVHTYRGGHSKDVCGLTWSTDSGLGQLASGGRDGLVHIWDSRNQNRWNFQFTDHAGDGGTVRALAWCPFRDRLLGTGGGNGSVKFWSTHNGTCIDSLQMGSRSQVCALLWSKNSHQFLTSCSSNRDQLTLWEYPSMVKCGQLVGHTSRALYLAQSPDGSTVASASGGADDMTVRLWNVFPPVPKKADRVKYSFHDIQGVGSQISYMVVQLNYKGRYKMKPLLARREMTFQEAWTTVR